MNQKYTLILLTCCLTLSCNTNKLIEKYESENLIVEQLTDHTFRHITYLETQSYGKVSCNGMIVVDNGEAIIIDTPSGDADSKELIDWVESRLNCKVKAVVATHFHIDCLGGLNEFHKRNIPSYASQMTLKLAREDEAAIPQNGFEDHLELQVGTKKLINAFLGGGHTVDNIVSYFPEDMVLFGGCLVKSMGAGKGNLADADVEAWSNTTYKVKEKFDKAEIVIPGHGEHGGVELLDYTIEKFADL